ncbi:YciI family protein [Dictyobacter formicarum]|uniref:YCII-related domain-containing protein n=1 Tax=Dictyobacter formicarum TaxID=2778368 RepID=A0ABQ3VJ94_9CHLR|nr:YciI family protein [Dictyobacter formicarum]GHO85744.1 hypothetical protein KSZ_37500 [Dictyobacter formicarum]
MEKRATFIAMIRPTRSGFTEEMLPAEAEAMQAHFAFMDQAVQERKFYLIGPCLDRAFGISIFEAASLEEAHEMMQHDPCVTRGVMSYEVHPYHISYFDGAEVTETP